MDHVVSKSELKARAFELFRQVQDSGEELIVTDRGKPVLKVVPYRLDVAGGPAALADSVLRYDEPLEPVAVEGWGSFE